MAAPDAVRAPVFQVEHLSLAYPARRGHSPLAILTDVPVRVERGGALTLVGPSGSGKSTVLRCLNRLEEPTAGTVRFDGHDTQSLDPRELRRRATLVMQTPVLFEGTVQDNRSGGTGHAHNDGAGSRRRGRARFQAARVAELDRGADTHARVLGHPVWLRGPVGFPRVRPPWYGLRGQSSAHSPGGAS